MSFQFYHVVEIPLIKLQHWNELGTGMITIKKAMLPNLCRIENAVDIFLQPPPLLTPLYHLVF